MADSRNLDQRLQEQKILKEQVKRLGKKGKDEAAKLEAEMESRHAAELAALAGERKQTAAEIVAVADSLYTVHLSGEQDSEQQQKVTHLGFLVTFIMASHLFIVLGITLACCVHVLPHAHGSYH